MESSQMQIYGLKALLLLALLSFFPWLMDFSEPLRTPETLGERTAKHKHNAMKQSQRQLVKLKNFDSVSSISRLDTHNLPGLSTVGHAKRARNIPTASRQTQIKIDELSYWRLLSLQYKPTTKPTVKDIETKVTDGPIVPTFNDYQLVLNSRN